MSNVVGGLDQRPSNTSSSSQQNPGDLEEVKSPSQALDMLGHIVEDDDIVAESE